MRIPFYSLKHQHDEIREKAERSFSSVYHENWFILGDQVKNFENNFTAYLGARYCAGVGNGFDAIFIALKALGIGRGDEVIVPAHTSIATWLAVSRTGATIRAVDVHEQTWLMDAGMVEEVLSPQIKAIVPVHLYGFPCDMQAISALALKTNLKIVEDNAQATGALVAGRRTGTWGHCNAFSFYPTKNLGALGDGGAVVTDDENVYHLTLAYRNYGARLPNLNELQGINSRLDELQAAFLNLKLQQLDRWNMRRREIAGWYKEHLQGIEAVALPQVVEGAEPVYHIFPIRVGKRNQLQRYLLDRGVETLVHYPVPPYQQKAYVNFDKKKSFTVAGQIAQTELSLPIWPGLEREAVEEICGLIRKFSQ